MFVASCRAACVGTGAATARVFFILRASRGGHGLCCRRPGGARACSGAARRAGETGGPDSHPALHAARCSRHVASRGRLLPFGRANNNALGETAARVSAVYRALLCASVLQAASKHRARTRRRFAFHALEDVTPRLLVDFGPWLLRPPFLQGLCLGSLVRRFETRRAEGYITPPATLRSASSRALRGRRRSGAVQANQLSAAHIFI